MRRASSHLKWSLMLDCRAAADDYFYHQTHFDLDGNKLNQMQVLNHQIRDTQYLNGYY